MARYEIGVLGGDGIGPEVTQEAVRVLETAATAFDFELRVREYDYGSERYLKTGELLPDEALDGMREHHAILLGAIGDPRVERGLAERAIVGGLRWKLDLYINLRPIKLYHADLCPLKGKTPEHVDMMVVRENTEDLYTGMGGFFRQGTPDEVAVQEMILTRRGADRAFRYAFELAAKRPRKTLTLVDKANAVKAFDLWRRVFEELGAQFPQVERRDLYIDAACMMMVRDPESFDTVITSNVFGDILTDLGAMIQGGMGLAASGNLHPGQVCMFEPIHGSAPPLAGRNEACPLAAILAGQMMLEHLGEAPAAQAVEEAVKGALGEGEIPSAEAGNGLTTKQMGDIISRRVREGARA